MNMVQLDLDGQITNQYSLYLDTERASTELARSFATVIQAPCVLTFSGEIGMGKTTLIRALLRAFGVTEAVKSPTFSLVEHYELETMPMRTVVHHVDLYRIQDETELEYFGFRDFFTPQSICCIEWPERAASYIEPVDVAFLLTREGNGRRLILQGRSERGCELIGQLCFRL